MTINEEIFVDCLENLSDFSCWELIQATGPFNKEDPIKTGCLK